MEDSRIIFSQHFVSSWKTRIAEWEGKRKIVEKLRNAIKSGNIRKKAGTKSFLIILRWNETDAYAIAEQNKHGELVMKTVMSRAQAGAMGWNLNMSAKIREMVRTK